MALLTPQIVSHVALGQTGLHTECKAENVGPMRLSSSSKIINELCCRNEHHFQASAL